MERIIFSHIGKSGGTSVFKRVLPGVPVVRITGDQKITDKLIQQLFSAKVIKIHVNNLNIRKVSGLWDELLKTSIRFSVIREPLIRDKSVWVWHLKGKSRFALPHIPSFDKKSGKKGKYQLNGYHLQDTIHKLSYESWLKLRLEASCSGTSSNFLDRQFGLHSSHGAESRNFNCSADQLSQLGINVNNGFDFQYDQIARDLGDDFIHSPRQMPLDFLLCTELLDEAMSALCMSSSLFRQIYCPNNINNYKELLSYFKGNRKNITPSEYDSIGTNISAEDRFKFYRLNRLDYTLWNSSIIQSVDLIKSQVSPKA